MCCSSHRVYGDLKLEKPEVSKHEGNFTVIINGYLDFSPKNFKERCVRVFKGIELAEKIAEVADESFHLLGDLLEAYASVEIYQFFQGLHHSAHHIEYSLHAVCFFGDIARLCAGQFIEYQDDERSKINYLRTAARVIHTVSHFFATAHVLADLNICRLGYLEPFVRYREALSALGYGLWAISLIWKRSREESLASNLAIHIGGCVFELLTLSERWKMLEKLSFPIAKLAALAGIVHACGMALRLMPADREPIINGETSFKSTDIKRGVNHVC